MMIKNSMKIIAIAITLLLCARHQSFSQTNVVPDNVELQVLKNIYDSLGGATWTTKTNWPTPGNWPASATAAQMGTWFGVTASNGDITQLSFSSNNLTGQIPKTITKLLSVNYINMNSNVILGQLPATIGNLTKLQYFYIYGNQLSGSLPESIGSLINLVNFHAYNNQLTGQLPPTLGNLNKVQNLYLYNNQFTGPIPASIGNMSALITLYLQSNQLSGTIPSSLGNLSNLTTLHLSNNQLTDSISYKLGNLVKLTQLNLSTNQLSGVIPASFGKLINLTNLNLSYNKLQGDLPANFSNLTKMVYFYGGANQFTGTIPPSLSSWTQIYWFDVSINKLSGPLPDNLFSTWTKLVYIAMGNNNFTGPFPSSVSTSNLITSLTASQNKFTSLPASMLSLPVVTTINFDDNSLASIPNFATHVNKVNLNLTLKNNQLDFYLMEPLIGAGIKTITCVPQKDISDVPTVSLQQTSPLVIYTRPAGQVSTVTWEKLNSNGTTWSSVTASDQDAVPTSYTRNAATTADEGTYRWKMTNTKVTGMTLQSAPILVNTPKRFAMDQLGFQYKYDGRKRMTAKKVPGADWVYMVYDNHDRLVLTQDAEQRKLNKWIFTKYDALNRPVATGIYTDTQFRTQSAMQLVVDTYYNSLTTGKAWYETFSATAGNIHNYDNKSFPQVTDPTAYLTITYYDSYWFKANWGSDFTYVSNDIGSYMSNGISYTLPDSEFLRINGQVTGTKVRTLDAVYNNNFKFLKSVTFYDDKLRPVQSVTDNNNGGRDRTSNLFDFTGKVLKSKTSQETRDLKWKDATSVVTTLNSVASTISGVGGSVTSAQTLPANTDGWIEITIGQLATDQTIALTCTSAENPSGAMSYEFYTSPSNIWVQLNGQVIESATPKVGDILRIERTGSTIKYYLNGVAFSYKSLLASTVLRVSVTLGSYGSIQDIRSSFSLNTTNFTERTFEYDHAGRLTKTFHSLNGVTPVLLAQNEYNELGQLVDKKLFSSDPIGTLDDQRHFKQSVDYRYNIRGWLTRLNNSDVKSTSNLQEDDSNFFQPDLFAMELGYNNSFAGLSNSAMYNGNISGMKWSVNQGLGLPVFGTPTERAYTFKYDPLNRLKSASHLDNKGTWLASNSFSEDSLRYDYNGNIKSLTRKGQAGSVMDVLTYDYGTGDGLSNQLLKVSDTGDKTKGFVDGPNTDNDYVYNANGSMTIDRNKDIISSTGTAAITYNHLNLPDKVTKKTGDYIKYIYDASGRKLSQQVYNSTNVLKKKTDYAGEYFYENDTLKFINHEEGRITMTGPAPEYQYHLKDHLGNVRLTFTTKSDVQANTATIEPANAAIEQSQFLYMSKAREVNSRLFDHTYDGATPPAAGAFAVRLSGSANEKVGLAKSLSVMPGDKIDVEVFAKYIDGSASNDAALMSIVAAIASGGTVPAGTVIDGAGYSTAGYSSYPFTGLLNHNDNSSAPKAYLNYLVYDRDYIYKTGGFKRITTAAAENGDVAGHTGLAYEGKNHERIAFDGADQILIREPGYVYIWLSNENATPVEVYFDDFKITHIKSPVVASDDYFPGGALFNSYTRENSTLNKYKYQTKEWQQDLSLNLYDFGARQYDPYTLHTTTPDPSAEKFYNWSPYSWEFGDPVRLIDPTGREPGDPMAAGLVAKVINAFVSLFSGSSGDTEQSAATQGHAMETNAAVSTHMQEAKAELKESVDKIPVLNVVGDLSSAQQSKTGGEMAGNLAHAAGNLLMTPTGGGKSGGGKTFETYTKPGPNGEVYSGRTSGKATPEQNVAARDANHHMNSQGYGKAVLDKSSTNSAAIRGREQINIQNNGGAQSQGGTSGNAINGISPTNPKKASYIEAAKKEF